MRQKLPFRACRVAIGFCDCVAGKVLPSPVFLLLEFTVIFGMFFARSLTSGACRVPWGCRALENVRRTGSGNKRASGMLTRHGLATATEPLSVVRNMCVCVWRDFKACLCLHFFATYANCTTKMLENWKLLATCRLNFFCTDRQAQEVEQSKAVVTKWL